MADKKVNCPRFLTFLAVVILIAAAVLASYTAAKVVHRRRASIGVAGRGRRRALRQYFAMTPERPIFIRVERLGPCDESRTAVSRSSCGRRSGRLHRER